MTTFFTGTRTPQSSDWSVTSTGSGATLYAFIATGSRAEWSGLSDAKAITYNPTNPNFSITLNSSLRTSGCWLWEVAIAFSPTNNSQDAIFAAAYRCLDADQITPRSLPATIVFNNTALIKTTPAAIAVNAASDLAAITPKIHGMIRSVTSQGGAVYRWDEPTSTWVSWRSSSAYQFAPRKPANEINPANDWYLPPPIYPQSSIAEGSPSTPIQFWLLNDGGAEWTTGDGIDLQVAVGGDLTLGYLLSGLCKCRVLGVTTPSVGVLDTSTANTANVNTTYTWQNTDSWLFQLINTVPTGVALCVEVWVQYYKSQLRVPSGSLLQIIPFNVGKYSYQTPGFAGFEDWLVGLKLLPTTGGLSDTGGSAKVGDWQFSNTPSGFLSSGLTVPPDSERQIIVDVQSRSLSVETLGTAINNQGTYRTDGLVGVVKTLPGVGAPSSSVSLNSTSGSVSVSVTHPSTVSSAYPVIGGLSASLNVTTIYIYLTVSGTIYRTTAAITPGTQAINITALGTVVSSIPNATFTNDLFTIATPVVSVGSLPGTIPNGTVACRVQYAYPSPNAAISVIEMEGAGMLRQQEQILNNMPGFFGVVNPTQLRQLNTLNYTGKEWGRVIISGVSKPFRFDPNSTAPDDSLLVFKPNDRTGAGRYIDELTVSISLQGIGTLNGLTSGTQTFTVGDSGTNFNINSTGSTHTFNLPTVSSLNRGVLTSAMYNELLNRQADWTAPSGSNNAILNKPSTFAPAAHNQDASTITTGILDPSRIPDLATTKITSGVFAFDRLPPITVGLLSGVILTNPIPGQVLKFNGTNWVNEADELAPAGSGIISFNGLNVSSQTLTTGTAGSNFNITSTGGTHTINIPTVGVGITRGLLSGTDWSDLINRQPDWSATSGKNQILNKPSTFPPTTHQHVASDITSGVFDVARIPDLSASKITSGVLNASRIPNLDAGTITTGTLNISRLPNITLDNLSDVISTTPTTGQALVFNGTNWIPTNIAGATNLDASIITSGVLDVARLPSHNHSWSAITATPTTIAGYGVLQIATPRQVFTPAGTTQTINWNSGSIVELALSSASGNVTLTLLNPETATTYLIETINGSTARNLIFPTGTLQAGGGGNVYVGTANQRDIIAVLWTGTQYRISVSKNYS